MKKNPTVYPKSPTRMKIQQFDTNVDIDSERNFFDESTGRRRSKMIRSLSIFYGFSLRVENLTIWVRTRKKHLEPKVILKGITTRIKAGSMTAIVGPSGSGKTTLMNFMAGRQENSQTFLTSCRYYLNKARVLNLNEFKNIIGYVLQEDIMDFRMTPR